MGDRCSGHCCRRFRIGSTSPGTLEDWRTSDIASDEEKMLADMLIPVEHDETWNQWWWACRHVQDNGDCGIYETRPEMCHKYPNGGPCDFQQTCTWDAAREGRVLKNGTIITPEQWSDVEILSGLRRNEELSWSARHRLLLRISELDPDRADALTAEEDKFRPIEKIEKPKASKRRNLRRFLRRYSRCRIRKLKASLRALAEQV